MSIATRRLGAVINTLTALPLSSSSSISSSYSLRSIGVANSSSVTNSLSTPSSISSTSSSTLRTTTPSSSSSPSTSRRSLVSVPSSSSCSSFSSLSSVPQTGDPNKSYKLVVLIGGTSGVDAPTRPKDHKEKASSNGGGGIVNGVTADAPGLAVLNRLPKSIKVTHVLHRHHMMTFIILIYLSNRLQEWEHQWNKSEKRC